MYNVNPFNPYQAINPAYIAPNLTSNASGHNFNQIIKVNGRNGAEAYQMPPNAQALLLDETQPLLWLKQTDGAGYPTITAYDIKPHQEQAQPDMKSLEERISRIEEKLNEPDHSINNGKNARNAASKANGADPKIIE